jgi:hypothetical protein
MVLAPRVIVARDFLLGLVGETVHCLAASQIACAALIEHVGESIMKQLIASALLEEFRFFAECPKSVQVSMIAKMVQFLAEQLVGKT